MAREPSSDPSARVDPSDRVQQGTPQGLEGAEDPLTVGDLRRQQRREVRRFGLGTVGQHAGAMFGLVVGGTVGGLIALAIALVAFDRGPVWVVLPIMGVLFGAVSHAVFWGGRAPEVANETLDAAGRPQTTGPEEREED